MARIAQSRQAFPLHELKALDDAQGTFSGYLAVFGNEDLGGDVIERGAFTKTLNDAREYKAAHDKPYLFPILYQHDDKQPCGGFTEAHEDEHGLFVKGELDLDTQLGRDTYSGMKKGYLTGLSIGYSTVRHKWVGNQRHLQELALFEGSPCTFAMNPEAMVLGVKNASDETPQSDEPEQKEVTPMTRARANDARAMVKALDFNTAFTQLDAADQLQDDWGDSFQALVNALYSTMCQGVYGSMMSGSDSFDAQEAADTLLQQFSDHMSALVKQSLAADFCPGLDDDGDSFYDPDGPNADDDDDGYGMMAADLRADIKQFRQHGHQGKSGRTISADNHAMMMKAADMIGEGHKAITGFLKANNPANEGDTPPSQSDSVYDPGFGKSASRSPLFHYANARAGARPPRTSATTADTKAAGAQRDAGHLATTPRGRDSTSSDDEIAQFRALMAAMRQDVRQPSAQAAG